MMPAIYVIFAFLSIVSYSASRYLTPVGDFYECFALVALFYYMNLVVMPSAPRRSMSFYGGDYSALQQVVPGGDLAKYSVSNTNGQNENSWLTHTLTVNLDCRLSDSSRPYHPYNYPVDRRRSLLRIGLQTPHCYNYHQRLKRHPNCHLHYGYSPILQVDQGRTSRSQDRAEVVRIQDSDRHSALAKGYLFRLEFTR
jgi:Organic solute transporter Ostalpha